MSTEAPTTDQPLKALSGLLSSHRVLSFRGPDAASFLQGYLTCDTDQLSARTAMAGAFTNLKGRVVANGWVWGDTSEVCLLLPGSLTEILSQFLKPYMNFSRTKLQVAEKAPHAMLLGEPAGRKKSTTPTQGLVQGLAPGAISIGSYGALTSSSSSADTTDISEAWLEQCIAHNEAVVTPAVSGAYLPQMLGLTDLGAVAFDKGCYLGQEVVARAQHRGEVKRRMRHATYKPSSSNQSAKVLTAGATLNDTNGKRVGAVVCASKAAVQIVTSLNLQENLQVESQVELQTDTRPASGAHPAPALQLKVAGSPDASIFRVVFSRPQSGA